MKKIATILLSLGVVLSFNTFFIPSYAGADADCESYKTKTFLGFFHSWDYGFDHAGIGEDGTCHVVMPKSIPTFIWTIVLNIFYDISIIAGVIAVIMIIANGFQYMTSGGSSDKVSKAKKGLMQAIIGLAIALLAATIVNFIVGIF